MIRNYIKKISIKIKFNITIVLKAQYHIFNESNPLNLWRVS